MSAVPPTCETNISWVFFTPERAFKLLKPVTLPFLDLSDAERRIAVADREIELNRRMAPDVYLGSADVHEGPELVDRMIVMRRLPAERALSKLVGTDEFAECVRRVAHAVAAFHARQAGISPAPMATRDAIRSYWDDNFDAIAPFVDSVIDRTEFERVHTLVETYLTNRKPLFDARIEDGWVRECHGDLIADDIFCLDDGPRIIDCLAFNDDWRFIDVLNDIAFLAIDLHRLAGPSAAQQLMEWYREFTNARYPASLAHHFVAYRGHVRTKVACLRLAQGDKSRVDIARTLHHLTLHHLERGRLRMILVGGGPGVGKTTLAERVADHYGYTVISSDEVRKDITGTPRSEHRPAAPDSGIYRPEATAAAYAEQRREARLLLESGEGVVLDATWSHAEHRIAARSLAGVCGAEFVELECAVPRNVAKERIRLRSAQEWNPSDATSELVDRFAVTFDRWPSALKISTAAHIDRVAVDAVASIERLPVGGT